MNCLLRRLMFEFMLGEIEVSTLYIYIYIYIYIIVSEIRLFLKNEICAKKKIKLCNFYFLLL